MSQMLVDMPTVTRFALGKRAGMYIVIALEDCYEIGPEQITFQFGDVVFQSSDRNECVQYMTRHS